MPRPAPVPTEDEIRRAAQHLGLADENGNYNQRDRNRIAAAIQRARQEQDAAAEPLAGTTAEVLGRFAGELAKQPGLGALGAKSWAAILGATAAHLLETQGLRLDSPREETTPS
ncbi:hypothetical protein [Nocardia arizonensis]|uniref:hypothetical protein n=1 Tax=Nocardia arizonensis TaxID=1141647 RepID=UPI0006D0BACC|nr:hypothetical protein [Nocardia arizonensis]